MGLIANPNLLTILSVLMVIQQAQLCFGACVTLTWVISSLSDMEFVIQCTHIRNTMDTCFAVLFEILSFCWTLGWMDGKTESLGTNELNRNASEVLKVLKKPIVNSTLQY